MTKNWEADHLKDFEMGATGLPEVRHGEHGFTSPPPDIKYERIRLHRPDAARIGSNPSYCEALHSALHADSFWLSLSQISPAEVLGMVQHAPFAHDWVQFAEVGQNATLQLELLYSLVHFA